MSISRNLKKRANELDIKQVDLCKSMKIPKTTMNGYFSGTREPDINTLRRLAKALDTTVEHLIRDDNNPTPDIKKEPTSEVGSAELLRRLLVVNGTIGEGEDISDELLALALANLDTIVKLTKQLTNDK